MLEAIALPVAMTVVMQSLYELTPQNQMGASVATGSTDNIYPHTSHIRSFPLTLVTSMASLNAEGS